MACQRVELLLWHNKKTIILGLSDGSPEKKRNLPEGPLPRMGKFRIHIAQFVLSSKATGLAT